jgi:hypothetical protein
MSADVDEYLRVRKLINGGGVNVQQTEDGGCSSRNNNNATSTKEVLQNE